MSDTPSDPRSANENPSSAVEPAPGSALTNQGMPFESLNAPQPLRSTPPAPARWLGFAGIIIGGLLGGMIGWGTGDVMGQTTSWAAVGALIGAVSGAIGVGIVATLTLRAMNEWHAVEHPEANQPSGIINQTASRSTSTDQTNENTND